MELPPDDPGLDLDEMQLMLPLEDLGLEDGMLGDHLNNHAWLVGQLNDITESDDHDLISAVHPEALEMDICDMCDAVPLPDDPCRAACRCKHIASRLP